MFAYYEKKYNIPRDTLHSISLQETGQAHPLHKKLIVWPWAVNLEGRPFYFDTKAEAVNFVKFQMRRGKVNFDIGCMQINFKYHGHNFKSIEHAFDPRGNINFGAKFLSEKFEQLGSWRKAIAHYHSATPEFGDKYSKSVFKIANKLEQNKKDIVRYYLGKNRTEQRSKLN